MVHTTVDPIVTSILITIGEDAVASAIATDDTAAKHRLDWLFKENFSLFHHFSGNQQV